MSSPGVTSWVKRRRTSGWSAVSELGVELLGAAGERAADPAELLVRARAHGRVHAPLEELGERELQQRQRAGTADDVADHRGDESRLEPHADALGRRDDRVLELRRRSSV